MTLIVVAACWSIASHNLLSVNFSLDRDVLTYGKTQNIIWMGQSKLVATIKDEKASISNNGGEHTLQYLEIQQFYVLRGILAIRLDREQAFVLVVQNVNHET